MQEKRGISEALTLVHFCAHPTRTPRYHITHQHLCKCTPHVHTARARARAHAATHLVRAPLLTVDWTTADVMKEIIIPETAAQKCRYVDLAEVENELNTKVGEVAGAGELGHTPVGPASMLCRASCMCTARLSQADVPDQTTSS